MADHDHEHHEAEEHLCSTKPSALMVELREHVPFSVSAVAIGLIVAGVICILGSTIAGGGLLEDPHAGHDHGPAFALSFFHLFHPAHMLFSGAATAAMFVRYERKFLKAIVVGIIGSIGHCAISDIAMPQISLTILGVHTPWHICVIEHPGLVLPFAGIGIFVGLSAASGVIRSTIISHSLHVMTSTMAIIFYMVGPLGVVAWIDRIGVIFVFVVLAVMVPCCSSDIVFPMLMSKSGRRMYEQVPHVH